MRMREEQARPRTRCRSWQHRRSGASGRCLADSLKSMDGIEAGPLAAARPRCSAVDHPPAAAEVAAGAGELAGAVAVAGAGAGAAEVADDAGLADDAEADAAGVAAAPVGLAVCWVVL